LQLPHLREGTEDSTVGFKNKVPVGLVANVLLCASMASAQDQVSSGITVLVNDSAGVDPKVLRHAENEAARLLHPAGISIQWVQCGATADCRRPLRSTEFVLHIVANGRTQSDLVFGEAFFGPDGLGKYADVFFDRVQDKREYVGVAQLLGAVSAHELGHLLLGSHSHSLAGIMQPVWGPESLRRIAMGTLTFTTEQERVMNSRVANERLAVTSLRRPGRLGLP
jgi:hypothetical protein